MHVYPDYYKAFRCVAGACQHSCCIGWEIDIDDETAASYEAVGGDVGARLKANICKDPTPHFILGAGERCPFLNGDNLCDLILTLGEDSLCEICAEHPRFHNALPGRVESGVGLCCEAAGRLILGKQEPTTLVFDGDRSDADDFVSTVRDNTITLLQDRSRTISKRVESMLRYTGTTLHDRSFSQWAEIYLDLERLDETWTVRLEALRDFGDQADFSGFDAYMASRQTEYEQFLVYLVYRHMAQASDETEIASWAAFAALGYRMVYALGAVQWSRTGSFSLDDQVELVRLYSSEIEYSDENPGVLIDRLMDLG